MSVQPIHVAIAILHCQGQFLLQLRDNISGIVYPGHWGLFGGHIEPGETPDVPIRRELLEEIAYSPPVLSEFGCYFDAKVVRHVYHAPLTLEVNQLVLSEGEDLSLLSPEQIQQGSSYSIKAAQMRPLVPTAQRSLLDFMNRGVVSNDF